MKNYLNDLVWCFSSVIQDAYFEYIDKYEK